MGLQRTWLRCNRASVEWSLLWPVTEHLRHAGSWLYRKDLRCSCAALMPWCSLVNVVAVKANLWSTLSQRTSVRMPSTVMVVTSPHTRAQRRATGQLHVNTMCHTADLLGLPTKRDEVVGLFYGSAIGSLHAVRIHMEEHHRSP